MLSLMCRLVVRLIPISCLTFFVQRTWTRVARIVGLKYYNICTATTEQYLYKKQDYKPCFMFCLTSLCKVKGALSAP